MLSYVNLIIHVIAIIIVCVMFGYAGTSCAKIWKKKNQISVQYLEKELEEIESLLNIASDVHTKAILTIRKYEILRTLARYFPTSTKHKYEGVQGED